MVFQNDSNWVKEEEKLCSVVLALRDEIGLQRKKTRFCENSDDYFPVGADECYIKPQSG
jgi:hypothetical protein